MIRFGELRLKVEKLSYLKKPVAQRKENYKNFKPLSHNDLYTT